MKKTIIKSALIATLSFLCLIVVAFSATIMVSPKTVAKLCENVGIYDKAGELYENQYEKTKKIADLKAVVDFYSYREENAKVAEFGVKLTYDYSSTFKQYLASSDLSEYNVYCERVSAALFAVDAIPSLARYAYEVSSSYRDGTALFFVVMLCEQTRSEDLALALINADKLFNDNISYGREELKNDLNSLKLNFNI